MDFVEQLKSSVDIVSVIGEYVRLRRSGAQRYMGLCPFHNEKSPSFTVHVVHQFYKCFSCGVHGDVIKFVMEKDGLSFYEALKSLAERYGIAMPKRSLARSYTECMRHLPPDSRALRPALATDVASTRRTGRPLATARLVAHALPPSNRPTSRSNQSAELRSRLRSATFDNDASPTASAQAAANRNPYALQQ